MHQYINKSIFFKAIKISLAAITAIGIAQLLGLNFAVSAGTVAILTIQPTKKETVKTAVDRLMAFIIALGISFCCFQWFGLQMRAFMIYLLFFILVCQMFGWYSAMSMCSVLVSHFLTRGSMSAEAVANEVLIFAIGVCIGILANLHLHQDKDYIKELEEYTDEQIRIILRRMSERIVDQDMSDYNEEGFVHLKDHIRKAKNVADINYKNKLRNADVYDIEYIRMRDRQCGVLYEMYKSVRRLETTPVTAGKISEFLKEMAKEYHRDNKGKEMLERFHEMDNNLKKKPLPIERKEFEDRAKLFVLLRNIEELITIKIEFAEKYANK